MGYHASSRRGLEVEAQQATSVGESSATEFWTKITKLMKQVASASIPVQQEQLTPRRSAAKEEYLKSKIRLRRDIGNKSLLHSVDLARAKFRNAIQLHQNEECTKFFDKVDSVHPRSRLSMTFKFVKRFRRAKLKSHSSRIPISQWQRVLNDSCSGSPPPFIEENDFVPLGPPPQLSDIEVIITRLKNGTATGQDNLEVELFKYGPRELTQLVQVALDKAWRTNVIPEDWIEATQVPLPKVPSPKSVNDFRRITLSNVIYKIYAIFLMGVLERYVPQIPLCQAGFLRNRSVDDQVFVLRRVLDERWRKGYPTFVLSLDLSKAFDMVDTKKLGEILLSYEVPAYLINRLIASILNEKSTIRWHNSRTTSRQRTRGVKQGCPISPYLFVIVLNFAIKRVCDRLHIDPNLSDLKLPFLLAYADDIVLIGESLDSLSSLLTELEKELLGIGLTLNDEKCKILLRDPLQRLPPLQDYANIANKRIKVVHVLRYLGVYVSSDLNRRCTVAYRIQSAYKIFYALSRFFIENRLPIETSIRLYHSIIIPHVLHGLKVATLTKQNRVSLRNMERYMVLRLCNLSRNPPASRNVNAILRGRSIIRHGRVQRLRYWGHIRRRPAAHVLRRALQFSLPGKFKRGRPCFTWRDSLNRELRRAGDLQWDLTIRDTGAHNAKCSTIYQHPDTDEEEY